MKSRTLFVLAATSCLVACGKQPPAEEVPVEEAPVELRAEESLPAAADFDEEFIDHMHVHAERVDELMFALQDGDLEAARPPAVWLSRHQAADRIPDDWLAYLESMQQAAREVENATDLDTARTAAERISIHCQECHAAAGVLSTD